jgi:hypothetical protein
MTPATPQQDLATQWNTARRLYPIYFELAREFVIDVKPCPDLETGVDSPEKETVDQANCWLDEMDQLIQVHQLRQFLQTSSMVDPDGLVSMVQHFLTQPVKSEAIRDKIDFLLVQYFSQMAPTALPDAEVDLHYVADALSPVLGAVEVKPPVWLNALDRVLESARHCSSLDELLHGGVLEQGRKAKVLAEDLFYMPVALAAFTRFGYLMRRAFFRLMLGDLNVILDGLNELEEKGVHTIDCRRAQFSAEEPILRLRMICQSWKVMFQAEYSSGQPLRMLVDLRASVENALGRGKPEAEVEKPAAKAKPASVAKPGATKSENVKPAAGTKPLAATKAGSGENLAAKPNAVGQSGLAKPGAKTTANTKAMAAAANSAAPEFEVSGAPEWDADASSKKAKK